MANNPYINRVDYNGTTLINLTADTVTPAVLMNGYVAHDKSGQQITGTLNLGAATDWSWSISNRNVVLPTVSSGAFSLGLPIDWYWYVDGTNVVLSSNTYYLDGSNLILRSTLE